MDSFSEGVHAKIVTVILKTSIFPSHDKCHAYFDLSMAAAWVSRRGVPAAGLPAAVPL